MERLESTKLSVELMEVGKEKPTKQAFSNVKANPTEAQVIKLGEVIVAIAPQDTKLDSVVKTEQSRIIKDEQPA